MDRREYTMTIKKPLTFALLLGLVLMAAAAQAATLFTPPLFPDGDSQIDCYLLNVSDQVRRATIEVFNRDGESLIPPVEVTLQPGTEEVASVPAGENPRYCKFVVEGWRFNFRASILVRKPGFGSISALPAE
jgi:hypothetical protein